MKDLILRDISKSFGDRQVLTHFSAVFPGGETTCILGPSGCGKTTLLRLILSLDQPDAGEILGTPRAASVVFQQNRLFESFSTLSNIAAVLSGSRRARLAAAEDCLAELGLRDSLHLPVSHLSGGMKRRVAIARALVAPAELLAMDEPFTGLDADTKAAVMHCVQRRCQGVTTILVTHDPGEAMALGARLLQLPSLCKQAKTPS